MLTWCWQTMWVVLVPTTTHIPSFVTVAHTELWIFAFVISQSEQICKRGIKYIHLVMRDHIGSTSAHHYPHAKFRHCSHTELWILAISVISQSEQICKSGIWYVHLVLTDHVGSTSAHHYPHAKFCHCSHTELWILAISVISQSE